VARPRKQFPLRISHDLYAAYEAWAADEFRSVNAQIEAVLADAARRAGRLRRTRPASADSDRDDSDHDA
jgi:hypothetical protein